LGAGIEPEHLNDDALGKALDDLYAYGVSELYMKIAAMNEMTLRTLVLNLQDELGTLLVLLGQPYEQLYS
jgi:hypothetical protein